MRSSLVTVVVLLACGLSARAQLHVGAGESWSYEFTSLEYVGPRALPAPNLFGGVHLAFSGVAPDTHYILEIYEDSLSEEPLGYTDSDINQSGSTGGMAIWQDLQGWVQLRVLSGELSIDWVEIDAHLPIDDFYAEHHQRIIQVPEPAAFSFLTLAGAVIMLNKALEQGRRAKRRTESPRRAAVP